MRLLARTRVAFDAAGHAAHRGPRGRTGRLSPFWRHVLGMLAAMVVGMFVTGAIFIWATAVTSWDEATARYPSGSLIAMATGMTVPMVVWMRYRAMGWRNTVEMSAAMVLPVIPFLCLVWFGVVSSGPCGAYCAVSVVAMLGLMRYRRDAYAHSMHAA